MFLNETVKGRETKAILSLSFYFNGAVVVDQCTRTGQETTTACDKNNTEEHIRRLEIRKPIKYLDYVFDLIN